MVGFFGGEVDGASPTQGHATLVINYQSSPFEIFNTSSREEIIRSGLVQKFKSNSTLRRLYVRFLHCNMSHKFPDRKGVIHIYNISLFCFFF